MKTGTTSSLNPYAASYIPLFKRALIDADNNVQFGQHYNISRSHGQTVVAIQFPKQKDHHSSELFSPTSQNSKEPKRSSMVDEEMDIAYLQMSFPGISNEYLHGVYLASKCLDEMNPGDSLDKLPDTLGIGDVPESGFVMGSQFTGGYSISHQPSAIRFPRLGFKL